MPVPGQSSLFTGFGQMMSTTYRAYKKDPSDAVSKHNAFWRRLSSKGKITVQVGGASIVTPIVYQGPGTFQRYSSFDPLNIGSQESITAAEFPLRQASVSLAISGSQMRRNRGEHQAVKLVKTVIEAARKEMANGLSVDVYSDGAASNQMGGTQLLVADSGLGTVGGIPSNTFTFWRNKVQSAAAPLQGGGAIVPSKTTIQSLIGPLWLILERGADSPDLIVFSDDYYQMFEDSLTDLKRYSSSQEAQGGIVNLRYKTADVFHDTGGGIPAAHGYFLNTDYFELVALEGANLDLTDELRPVNQDAIGQFILWEGNVTCNQRALQGVMKA